MTAGKRVLGACQQVVFYAWTIACCLWVPVAQAQSPSIEDTQEESLELRSGLTFRELETTPPPAKPAPIIRKALANPPIPIKKPTMGSKAEEETVAEPDKPAEHFEAEKPNLDETGSLAGLSDFLSAEEDSAANSNKPASQGLRRILNRKVIRAGIVLRTPYAMHNASGDLIGHDIELARAVAETLKVGVKFETRSRAKLIEMLRMGEIDIIVGGVSIDPDLALKINFTQPYTPMDLYLIAFVGTMGTNPTPYQLNDPGMDIGAVQASPAARAVHARFPRANFIAYADDASAKAAFLKNKVAVLATPSPFPNMLDMLTPGRFVRVLGSPLSRTAHGIAVAQGDPEFLAYLNAWIVARKLDMTIDRAHSYWFEGIDWIKRLKGRQATAG
jgi:polar amino acid transport system substrate-binding protein